jgi:hypothetical protein
MVRREASPRFPDWTTAGEDLIYYLELLEHYDVAVVETPLVVYRLHAQGQTARPELAERRDASFRRWFEINRGRLSWSERGRLAAALKRRELWALAHRALALRRGGDPAGGLRLYLWALARAARTPASGRIAGVCFCSGLGAVLESLRVRKHPARVGQ